MAVRRSSTPSRKADPGTWVKISCGVVSAPCRMEMPVTPSRPMMPTSIRRPPEVLATIEMVASSGNGGVLRKDDVLDRLVRFDDHIAPLQFDPLKMGLEQGQIVRRER